MKKWKCDRCDTEFTRRDSLYRHLKNVHKVDNPAAFMPESTRPKAKQKPEEVFEKTEEMVKSVVSSLESRKRLTPEKTTDGELKPEIWLQLFGDLHYGLQVKPLEVGGLSEYNSIVAKERLEYLATTQISLLRYYPNKPKELIIGFLGDMIDNAIMRGNQLANVECGVTDQVMLVTELVVDYLVEVSKHFATIKCYGVFGNHGRVTKHPTDASPKDNFDRLVYWAVKERIKDMKGISMEYSESQHMIIEISGWRFWIEHGDTVRAWAGIPFYGAKREKGNIAEMLSVFKEHAHYLMIGHHHTPADFNGIYINGSFVGGDIFSIGRLRRMSMPSQTLLGISEKHGVVWKRDLQLVDTIAESELKIYNKQE